MVKPIIFQTTFWSSKLRYSKTDSKKLYKTTTNICGDRKINPPPEHTKDKKLADEFLCFFTDKTETIRKILVFFQFINHRYVACKLESLESFTDSEIRDLLAKVKNKKCDLDLLLTNLTLNYTKSLVDVLCTLLNEFPEQ